MKESEDKIYYGGHLVAFLDILGQSTNLDDMKKGQWWKVDKDTITSLQNSYGRVLKFREIFNRFLSKFCKPSKLDVAFQKISDPDQLKLWNQFGEKRILTKGISDSVIMTLPLFVTNGLAPMKSIYGVLGACGSSMLISLNYKFALRGAVEIGPCIYDTNSNEVYGSALNDAVKYEKEADWPRVVVGQAIVDYLNQSTELPTTPIVNQINASTAQKCLSLISQDENGIYFVDYLGKGFEDLFALQNTDKVIDGALHYINMQLSAHGPYCKIYDKYSKLKNYFESRL
jgi:hypothetical protein